MKPFASDKLRELESKEQQIRKSLGNQYYENKHRQYQNETDFEGLMMCISLAIFLAMFCSCIR